MICTSLEPLGSLVPEFKVADVTGFFIRIISDWRKIAGFQLCEMYGYCICVVSAGRCDAGATRLPDVLWPPS